jgi:hypothetical protein
VCGAQVAPHQRSRLRALKALRLRAPHATQLRADSTNQQNAGRQGRRAECEIALISRGHALTSAKSAWAIPRPASANASPSRLNINRSITPCDTHKQSVDGSPAAVPIAYLSDVQLVPLVGSAWEAARAPARYCARDRAPMPGLALEIDPGGVWWQAETNPPTQKPPTCRVRGPSSKNPVGLSRNWRRRFSKIQGECK